MGDLQEEIKTLQNQLDTAESYEERAQLRKKIRELKKASGQTTAGKKTGQASYLRPGMTVVGPGKTSHAPSYLVPTGAIKATPTTKPPTAKQTTTTTTTVTYRRSSQSSESEKGRDTATPPVEKEDTSHSAGGVNGYKDVTGSVGNKDCESVTESEKESSRGGSCVELGKEIEDVDYGNHTENGFEDVIIPSPEDFKAENLQDDQQQEEELKVESELRAIADEEEDPVTVSQMRKTEDFLSEEPQSETVTNGKDASEDIQEPEEDASEDIQEPEEDASEDIQEPEEDASEDIQEPEEDENTESVEPPQVSQMPEELPPRIQNLSPAPKDNNELAGDFRSRLRSSAKKDVQSKPSPSKTAEQIDFRNVLKRAESPSTKLATSAQSKARDTPDYKSVLKKKEQEAMDVKSSEKKTTAVTADSSYEERREARRRKRELERLAREGKSIPTPSVNSSQESKTVASPQPVEEPQPIPVAEPPKQPLPVEKPQPTPVVEPPKQPLSVEKPQPTPVTEPPKQHLPKEPTKSEFSAKPNTPPLSETDKSGKDNKVTRASEDSITKNDSSSVGEESTDSAVVEDSYEARRLARQKAREAKKKASQDGKSKPEEKMTYKQKREMEMKKNAPANSPQQPAKTAPPPMKRQTSNATKQLLQWAQHKTRFYDVSLVMWIYVTLYNESLVDRMVLWGYHPP
jgi:hypothetical protein